MRAYRKRAWVNSAAAAELPGQNRPFRTWTKRADADHLTISAGMLVPLGDDLSGDV
jgi:hypothetical protein